MTTIVALAQDQVLTATVSPKLACNNRNTVKLHITFSPEWNSYTARSAVFATSADPTPYEEVLINGECIIPSEVLADEGLLYIFARGVNANTNSIKATTPIAYKVLPGTPSLIVSAPTADVYHQLLTANALLQSRLSAAESAVTVDSEVIGIRTGADGKTYTTAGDAVRGQINALNKSITPYVAFVIIDKVEVQDKPYASENTTSGGYTIHLPKLLICFGKEHKNVEAIDIPYSWVNGNLHYIYYDFDSNNYGLIYWQDFYGLKNIGRCALIGTFRTEMRCVELFEHHQKYNYFLPFVSVIVGQKVNGVNKPLPTIDTITRKMTFPTDTILRVDNGYGSHFILTETDGNTTCDFSGFASSAVHIVFDTVTKKLYGMAYGDTTLIIGGEKVPVFYPRFCLVCSIRTWDRVCSCTFPYICDGYFMGQDLSPYVSKSSSAVKGVNHRGFADAPENTLSAYRLSKEKGFAYVECDVSFTSDGVAVLLHDSTVDRTSNGTGSISTMTFSAVRSLDFGSWKSSKYAGEKIPTFEEFIVLCKRLGLHPYIELKAGTETQIKGLYDTVRLHGMKGNVTWISFNTAYLGYIRDVDTKARLGYVVDSVDSSVISKAMQLATAYNEVFIDCSGGNANANAVQLCADADLPLEVWTVNTESAILALNGYVSGVTSDNIIAGKVLANSAMSE